MPSNRILLRKKTVKQLFINELLFSPRIRTYLIVKNIANLIEYSEKTIYADLRPLKILIKEIRTGKYTLPENYESIM